MSFLMDDLKTALKEWCEDEKHLDVQITAEDDFSVPQILLRFLDDPFKFNLWYGIELRYMDERIDTDMIQHFVDSFSEKQTIVRKIMVSKVGFSQNAIVKGHQLGVECLTFAHQPNRDYYGYIEPVIDTQTIDSPKVLSQREWHEVHEALGAISVSSKGETAVVVDPRSEQTYTWRCLQSALPIVTPYKTASSYTYDLEEHELQIKGLEPLPIDHISFKYCTEFKPLDASTEADALAELLQMFVIEE